MTDFFTKNVGANELSLMRDLYSQMYDLLGEPGPPENRIIEVHRQALAGERSFWIAYSKNDVIGFVDFKLIPYQPTSTDTYGMIFDLFIKEQFHREGYGTKLAKQAIATLSTNGADPIELNVLPTNTRALAFWQSLGFELHLYALKRAASSKS